MSEQAVDAIVVGAGVAGSTAAYLLAKAGLEVALIERGPYPGSKNLSGGVLYTQALRQVLPNFLDEAPVERAITNQVVSFLSGEAHVNLDFKSQAFGRPPYNAVTVLRSRFDRWLAEQAESAGAMLVAGIKVERLLRDGAGRIAGVAAGDDEIRAGVVIAADGATSFLAQEAGLRGRIPTGQAATGVKEVIGLPREVLEDRFHLNEGEGAAYTMVGYATRGVPGGGFLYTNRDSLSLGLVMRLEDLIRTQSRPAEIFEDFKAHPLVAPLIKGGRLLEYGAHLVPEGGMGPNPNAMLPKLSTDGLLVIGDAAGLGINSGFVIRGMDLAIGSAIHAAGTVIEAKSRNDYSAATLQDYARRLDASFVMDDMRTYARAPAFLHNPRLFTTYPELLANIMTRIYTQDGTPKEHLTNTVRKSLNECDVSIFDVLKDFMEGARAL
jgi:electron transfer flavoprotein-quinone oxidoreductase